MSQKHVATTVVLFALLIIGLIIILVLQGRIVSAQYGYDVIVVGGDPEGVSAAVAAAREGAKVLLVDKRNRLGGLYTVGGLCALDLNCRSSSDRRIVNEGFFKEFHDWVGNKGGFDINRAQAFFDEIVRKNNIQVKLNTKFVSPIIEDNVIKGIRVYNQNGYSELYAKRIVDATQDADVARASGVPYTIGREDLGLKNTFAAATLVFSLKDVDWNKVVKYLETDGNSFTGADSRSAWGYEIMFEYEAKDPDIQMRGLNIGRQDDGTVYINALQIFNVNPLDEKSKEQAIEKAKRELPDIIKFMNKNCPGFENAKLYKIAEELYIRESVHILGEKRLTAEDVFENRYYEDGIAYGSYMVDLQAARKGDTGNALSGMGPYSIPFGVMVPQKIDNLLVTSKAASYDTIAHGSARTVPVGMALGQAGGVACMYSIENNVTFREICKSQKHINNIKKILARQGVDLSPIKITHPEATSWVYPHIKSLRQKGMLTRGYENDYRLYEKADKSSIHRIFVLVNQNTPLKLDIDILEKYKNDLSKKDILNIVNEMLKTKYKDFKEMYHNKILTEDVYKHIARDNVIDNAELYGLMDNVIKYIINSNPEYYKIFNGLAFNQDYYNPVRLMIEDDNYKLGKYEPEEGCYLGAYVIQDTIIDGSMAVFNNITKKKHASFFKYVGYGQEVPYKWLEECKKLGAAPHIALEPNEGLDKVQDDKYLRNFARALGSFKSPIFLRFASEMNGAWTKYGGDPKKYISKWRMVHDVMEQEAPNVMMVWTVFTFPQSTILKFYPGDEYVDWVGVNIYNVVYHNNKIEAKASYEDPLELLDYVYNNFSNRKPIQISEFGATHYSITDNKYYINFAMNKIVRMYKGLEKRYPRVKSIFYFDVNNLINAPKGRKINDYSLTSDKNILNLYTKLISKPYFLSDIGVNKEGKVCRTLKLITEKYKVYGNNEVYVNPEIVKKYFGGKLEKKKDYIEITYNGVTKKDENLIKKCRNEEGKIWVPLNDIVGYFNRILKIDTENNVVIISRSQ